MKHLLDSLPIAMPLPQGGPRRDRARMMRLAAWSLLAAALIVPAVQFQIETARAESQARQFAAQYGTHPPAGVKIPKRHHGAIGRWRSAVEHFWQGKNIYMTFSGLDAAGLAAAADEGPGSEVWLHPNMPFTVVLLTPFALLPAWAMALSWNVLKITTVLASILMIASLYRPTPREALEQPGDGRRIPDWLVGLALLWSIQPIILDIQHGNTNIFVLGLIVLHLWLYRRGRDVSAGAALAMAICLKMTPAIFLLYWLYQRNWRLLAGATATLTLAMTALPLAACVAISGGDLAGGVAHWQLLTGTWLRELIFPGLFRNASYPIHINQSLSGVLERYFLAGPDGNIFYNPDDNLYSDQTRFGWITLHVMDPVTLKWIIRAIQVAIVGALAWAIGWRKLPRDDNRRWLHAGLVVLAMLVLNQRTWDHHAAVLLLPATAIWYAIARGGLPDRTRRIALGLVLAAGVLLWTIGSDPFVVAARLAGQAKDVGKEWADWYKAYGPTFWHFVLMLLAGLVLARGLKRQWR